MKQLSTNTKLLAVKHYDKNKNQVKTCAIFNCSPRSLMRWYNKYKEKKDLERKPRNSISYKITKTHIKYILSTINSNKTITIKDLTNLINEKFKVKFSKSNIAKVIRDNNITLKQTCLLHIP